MEELLVPEVSIGANNEETSVTLDGDGANKENSNEVINVSDGSVGEHQHVADSLQLGNRDLLKELESNPANTPEEFSHEELEFFQKIRSEGQPAVQFQRIHCTACGEHLGSAPINQNQRFIHPLLRVLLCKRCYDFYCSGEFDKDEDGSELYCRWCGEGGNVLCCAQCPYVFCKKCIRKNLGKKKLEEVKESDDWLCFVCVPSQLINLRITVRALYEFVQNEIKYAKSINNPEILKTDHTLCCVKKAKPQQPKRKRVSSPDLPYDPYLDSMDDPKRKKMLTNNFKQKQKKDENKTVNSKTTKIWDTQEEDEVVCTPDLTLYMDDEETETPNNVDKNVVENGQGNENSILANYMGKSLPIPQQVIQQVPQPPQSLLPPLTPAAKKVYTITPSPMFVPILPKPAIRPVINNIKPVMPTIKLSNNIVTNGQSVITVTHNLKKTASSTRLVPGLKHEWFDRAMHLSARVNQNLSTRLANLSAEQNAAATLEELASVHNRLQEILSSSINSLIQIRKNLRNEFLEGLNKLKFTSASETPAAEVPPAVVDDDDVILIEGNEDTPTKNGVSGDSPEKPSEKPPENAPTPPPTTLNSPGQYLKVKPISKLVNPEDPIEIIDDTVDNKQEKTEDSAQQDKTLENNKSDGKNGKPEDELQGIDENLNPEVLDQIKKAIEQSKLEKMLHDTLKISNIPTEELKRMLSVKVNLVRRPLEAILAARRAKIMEKKKAKKVQEMEDIEQLLETSIVHKSSVETESISEDGGQESDRENSDADGENTHAVSEEYEISDEEHKEKDKEDILESEYKNPAWDSDSGTTQEKDKREENSSDPHTVDSGIDVECDHRVSKEKTQNNGYHDDDVLSVSSHEDKDKDFRMSFSSEVECDA